MTIEQLLEALPSEVKIIDRLDTPRYYELKIIKHTNNCWTICYGEEGYRLMVLNIASRGTLREALEAVYQDLKDNNYL